MGGGLNKPNKQANPFAYFSQNKSPNKSLSNMLTESKIQNISKEILDKIGYLTGNKINSSFKNGKKRKELISKEVYFKKDSTPEIICHINSQVFEINETLLRLGYISEKLYKITQESCMAIRRCFILKFKFLDLSSEVNCQRVFSILKVLVELYHICKFYQEENVFLEGRWWPNVSENRYISALRRKIIKKCEAIAENYEKSASEDEGTPSTSDVPTINTNLPNRRFLSGGRFSENLKENEKTVRNDRKSPSLVQEKTSHEEKKEVTFEQKENSDNGNHKVNMEKILKLKKKIDLNLDHIEEMPINFESSSKRIDFNDVNFNDFDFIKENSDEKIHTNNSKKTTILITNQNNDHKSNESLENFGVINKVLLEINEIKECLKEKAKKKVNPQIVCEEDETSQDNSSISQISNTSISPKNKKKTNEIKTSRENEDTSEFIKNYLTKTYANVIKEDL